jgi:hypothetical protein
MRTQTLLCTVTKHTNVQHTGINEANLQQMIIALVIINTWSTFFFSSSRSVLLVAIAVDGMFCHSVGL